LKRVPTSKTVAEPLPYTETVCENRHGELSCDDGSSIRVISAFYGRHDTDTCPHSHIHTTSCHSDRLEFVKSL
jgi:hypothetical protein